MAVPGWMAPPDPPQPARGATGRPWVVDQRPGPDGIMRVTWATSDLRRFVLAVPETAWIEGDHHRAGELTAAFLAKLDPLARDQHQTAHDDD